jgi:hypothetical protein
MEADCRSRSWQEEAQTGRILERPHTRLIAAPVLVWLRETTCSDRGIRYGAYGRDRRDG